MAFQSSHTPRQTQLGRAFTSQNPFRATFRENMPSFDDCFGSDRFIPLEQPSSTSPAAVRRESTRRSPQTSDRHSPSPIQRDHFLADCVFVSSDEEGSVDHAAALPCIEPEDQGSPLRVTPNRRPVSAMGTPGMSPAPLQQQALVFGQRTSGRARTSVSEGTQTATVNTDDGALFHLFQRFLVSLATSDSHTQPVASCPVALDHEPGAFAYYSPRIEGARRRSRVRGYYSATRREELANAPALRARTPMLSSFDDVLLSVARRRVSSAYLYDA